MNRCAFHVRGRVQGVGFRLFVVRSARVHGLAGWVRNEPDGSVKGEAEGSSAALIAFFEDLRLGPPAGRVESLETAEVSMVGEAGFSVR